MGSTEGKPIPLSFIFSLILLSHTNVTSARATKMMPLVCIRKQAQLKQNKLFGVMPLVGTIPEGHFPFGKAAMYSLLLYSPIPLYFTFPGHFAWVRSPAAGYLFGSL